MNHELRTMNPRILHSQILSQVTSEATVFERILAHPYLQTLHPEFCTLHLASQTPNPNLLASSPQLQILNLKPDTRNPTPDGERIFEGRGVHLEALNPSSPKPGTR
jgi:hypothetical protein